MGVALDRLLRNEAQVKRIEVAEATLASARSRLGLPFRRSPARTLLFRDDVAKKGTAAAAACWLRPGYKS